MQSFWNFSTEMFNNTSIIEQDGKRYTYEQLTSDVQQCSNQLKSAQKQLVLVLAKNNYESIVCYLAAFQNRDVVMLINVDLESGLVNKIINSYRPSFIIGDINHVDYCKYEDIMFKRKIEPNYEIHPDLALLLSTSGTTGSVKFVRLSYNNINSNARSIAEYLNIRAEDRGLANLPMHYSYGLSAINSHLYAGATLLLTNESVLTKGFWEFIKNEQATSFAGVPYTYQMLQRIGFQNMDLPHLRYFTQAGGRLNEKLVCLFGEYAQKNEKRFFVMYGQTEATARISYLALEDILKRPTSIGKAIPGGQLFLDSETNELLYEGPNVMLGYATSFHDLSKGDEQQGRLKTGDLAEVDEDGFYYIKGRMKRFIKLFGLRLNLDDIEKQIEATMHTNVVCVGTDDKMAVATLNEGLKEEIQALIEQLYKLHRSAFKVKIVEEIPRLPNGKVNYEAVKEMIL